MKQRKTNKIYKGFSLIELIAVMAVFSVIGTIIVTIISTVLRSSKKVELLTNVRQSGDFTLSQMVRSIRYAGELTAPATCNPPVTTNSVTITSATDNGITTYSCPVQLGSPIASNGAALTDDTAVNVTNCSFYCQQSGAGFPPIITIKFTLTPKNANNLEENLGSLSFDSSVTLRNYNP